MSDKNLRESTKKVNKNQIEKSEINDEPQK